MNAAPKWDAPKQSVAPIQSEVEARYGAQSRRIEVCLSRVAAMLKSVSTLSVLLVSLGATLLSPVASAQAWPSKPSRLIIPFPAGGAADIIERTLAQKRSVQLGQTVIVDNKPDAGGTLGSNEASKAAPTATRCSWRRTQRIPSLRRFTKISRIRQRKISRQLRKWQRRPTCR